MAATLTKRFPRVKLALAALFLPVLLGLSFVQANAQEADAPEGAIIDSVEMSGFSPYSLSPGLQK